MKVPFLVIGGGLSGLAAALRFARFSPDVLLVEKHSRIGGLNSYYYRKNRLFETGLHAITNFAEPGDKKAPVNRLLRQLKLSRKDFTFHQQRVSEIHFANQQRLLFSNSFDLFHEQIAAKFPRAADKFSALVSFITRYDPFQPAPFRSARTYLEETLHDPLLVDMIFCPLMYYGSSIEDDMDLGQFVIMFRAIFMEGFFRPEGTIKDLLDTLEGKIEDFGGTIRLKSGVQRLLHQDNRVTGALLDSGEEIEAEVILSTIGHEETLALLQPAQAAPAHVDSNRLGFVESIFQLPVAHRTPSFTEKTIIFYNNPKTFHFRRPDTPVDFESGVICFPSNFQDITPSDYFEIRATHLADFSSWDSSALSRDCYLEKKAQAADQSKAAIQKIIGHFNENIVYEDTFTPVTIKRYTAKKEGAIYGSPVKIKDGNIGFTNLFLGGTDQGFLGIIGSMLSGVSMVNMHILPKL